MAAEQVAESERLPDGKILGADLRMLGLSDHSYSVCRDRDPGHSLYRLDGDRYYVCVLPPCFSTRTHPLENSLMHLIQHRQLRSSYGGPGMGLLATCSARDRGAERSKWLFLFRVSSR